MSLQLSQRIRRQKARLAKLGWQCPSCSGHQLRLLPRRHATDLMQLLCRTCGTHWPIQMKEAAQRFVAVEEEET